ncbi:hypothetical protein CC2G_013369 [Coprinopsis cinerea AmutBmut pab1-1]|nr:hypothetical protein CC2G_013369 [Coprinopsis cinerea AmutBmut pab1-1]
MWTVVSTSVDNAKVPVRFVHFSSLRKAVELLIPLPIYGLPCIKDRTTVFSPVAPVKSLRRSEQATAALITGHSPKTLGCWFINQGLVGYKSINNQGRRGLMELVARKASPESFGSDPISSLSHQIGPCCASARPDGLREATGRQTKHLRPHLNPSRLA